MQWEDKCCMPVAVCCETQEEYVQLECTVKQYAREKKYLMIPCWFSGYEEFRRANSVKRFRVIILSCDDIVNQELAISARDLSELSHIIWIGKDTRFGLSSYRVGVTNFIVKPVTKEDIWDSLDRCVEGILKKTGYLDFPLTHDVGGVLADAKELGRKG